MSSTRIIRPYGLRVGNSLSSPAVNGAEYDEYTSLMLHMDGSDDGTSFPDAVENFIITRSGTVTKTGTVKFGTASGYFASGDYLRAPDSDVWNYGSDNISFDFWVYPTSVAGVVVFMSQYQDVNNNMTLYTVNGEMFWECKIGGSIANRQIRSTTFPITVGSWQHLAFVKQANEAKIFHAGIQLHLDNFVDGADFAAPLEIAGQAGGTIYPYVGYMDELRVSRGSVRWWDTFPVPTGPYS